METDVEERMVEGRGRVGRVDVDIGAEGLAMILF